jgi:autotransporter-associated beta strand protein
MVRILLALLSLSTTLYSDSYTWTGAANDQTWETTSNWDSNIVPGPNDTAVLSQPGTAVSNVPQFGSPNIQTLEFNGNSNTTSIGSSFTGSTISNIISTSGQNTLFSSVTLTNPFLFSTIQIDSGTLSLPGNVTFNTPNTVLTGGGVLVLGGANTWQSMSQLGIAGGNLQVNSLGALGGEVGQTPPASMLLSSSTIKMGVDNFTIPSSSTINILLGSSATLNTNGFNATVAADISGNGAINKTGLGTLFLTGNNSYTQGTVVDQGILQGDFSSLQGNILINAGANVTFNQSGSATYLGSLSGAGAVTSIGTGILTFSGVNTYSGATSVNAGTLQAGSTTAFSSNSSFSITSGATLSLGTNSNTVVSLTGPTGSFVDLGTATLTINNGSNQTFAGVISGTGSLTLISGTFSLRGTNTYSGNTTIAGGILNIVSDNNLGTSTFFINNQATLQAGTSFTSARSITLSGGNGNIDTNGNTLTMTGQITGPGGFTKLGLGTLVLTSSANDYTGETTLFEGTINVNDASNLGTNALTINNGGILQAGIDGINLATPIHVQGTSNIDTNNFSFQLSGVIDGSGSLNKINQGTLILSGNNSYQGGTILEAGALTILSGSNLGSGSLTMNGGTTLQAAADFTLNASRSVFIRTGSVTIDTGGFNCIIDGPITGPGQFVKTGAGGLALSGANSYSGGTYVVGGSLSIASAGNLGSGPLTMNGGTTLLAAGHFFLPPNRTVNLLNGVVTLNTAGFNPTIAGPLIGASLLQKTGNGTLTLLGANTYSGGTIVSAGTLLGSTTSLVGNIDVLFGAELKFNQTITGTFSGGLVGSGSLFIEGGGTVVFPGNYSNFLGPVTVLGNSTFILNGSLSSSAALIQEDSLLKGTGVIGPLKVHGTVIPGTEGAQKLTVNGDFSFDPGILLTQLTPTSSALLTVTGIADLTGGTSQIQFLPGFYGFNGTKTILTAGLFEGTFAQLILDPGFIGNLVYHPTEVQLMFEVLNPFFGFPFGNANERAVGKNIDALRAAEEVSIDLFTVIDSLQGFSIQEINNALNQLHPAHLSAYAEWQAEHAGQLLSLFHRKPTFCCHCYDSFRLWVEPFGNWLREQNEGMQIGFHATTRGIAIGTDIQFLDSWTIGLGGAYSISDLKWSKYHSYGYVESGYAAFYNDFSVGNFFLGFSGYVGKDWIDNVRKIRFSTIDRQAKSHIHGFEMGAQLTSAYYFGTRSMQLYPYATADFLYLKNDSFSENGAQSLNLEVTSYRSSNLRAEAGGGFSFVDRNDDESICFAPMLSMGYVLELPLHRDHFHARFSGCSIPFRTTGWDMAWQLLNLKVGLDISYFCFTLSSVYDVDVSPESNSPFLNQRANFNLRFSF